MGSQQRSDFVVSKHKSTIRTAQLPAHNFLRIFLSFIKILPKDIVSSYWELVGCTWGVTNSWRVLIVSLRGRHVLLTHKVDWFGWGTVTSASVHASSRVSTRFREFRAWNKFIQLNRDILHVHILEQSRM